MKKLAPLLAAALLTLALTGQALASVYVWTGIGNGWYNQLPPPNDGTANIVIYNVTGNEVLLPGDFSVNTVTFGDGDAFRFLADVGATLPLTLTIANGVMVETGSGNARADFESGITVNVAGPQLWNLGNNGVATIHGKLTGTGDLVVNGTNQVLLLTNLSGNASDYSGNIVFTTDASAPAGAAPIFVVWGSNSLAPASALTFTNGGTLITHGAPTLSNSIILNTGPLAVGQTNFTPFRLRTWDGVTTLSGSILLANNTTLFAQTSVETKVDAQYPNNTGSRPLPGPFTREPTLITGAITDGGLARSLHVTGPGMIVLAGNNTYTGGTAAGYAAGGAGNAGGSLIFATQGAIPASGTINAGLSNQSGAAGYVGIATNAVPVAGDFNTFLTRFNPLSSGAVGLDSLTLSHVPSTTPSTFGDNIDLTHFTTNVIAGVKLGTATSVVLTGTITPQNGEIYHFGNGGGKLYVQSSLGNLTDYRNGNPLNPVVSRVEANSTGSALMTYLTGTNTYTGGTSVNNSFVIFDGASALPATGLLRANGGASFVGASYIGFTDAATGVSTLTGAGLTTLLNRFDKPNTWGVVGFDTHIDPFTSVMNTPVTVSNLDLTGFNDGVFVGTTSAAILDGTLTTTSVANGSNAANTLRLTAGGGGMLTVNSTLADGAQALKVMVGTPSFTEKTSDGTVLLNGNNTYTGGTTVNPQGSITLAAGHNNALGTGALTFSAQSGSVGISAAVGGLTIPNAINFAQAAPGMGFTPLVMLTGPNDFTLSGNISGPGVANENVSGTGMIMLVNPAPVNVTLTGNNSNFHGYFQVGNGTLTFGSDNAAGDAEIGFDSSAATVAFTSANPVITGGLDGNNGGNIVLNGVTNLTIDTSREDRTFEFNGNITGPGGAASAASLTVMGGVDSEFLYLFGHNNYTGGTNIVSNGALGLGTSDAAGSGAITINSAEGGLAINTGVTLVNPIQLTAGGLAGLGTFDPVSFNGVVGGAFQIGAGQIVLPGLPDDGIMPGTLTFAGDTVFGIGGRYQWGLMDVDPNAEGHGVLNITGGLDLSSLAASSFIIGVESGDDENGNYNEDIIWGGSYSYAIVTTGSGITGFNAANFAFDTSHFQGGMIPSTMFNVTSDGSTLFLNFTAIPEPSTYALMAIGLFVVGLSLRRRRTR